ncbi:MAG TPA: ABC transporter ATP-binding protein [Verrucomicrobiae bacterium]|jgi:ATP-binding cassette subfamily B protein/subfamily B ATP-binding cassette protein MsbA|nr:ABC transporter ATP-binding protein [Verrucomicrobiae bacterium]
MKDLFRALKYFRAEAARVVGVFGLMLVSVGLNVLKPWPVAVLIDSVLGQKPWPGHRDPILAGAKPLMALWLSLAIFLLHFAQGGFSAAQNYCSIQTSLRGFTRLRQELFARLLRLSLRFHQGASAGDLIYRASWDTYSVQTLFQQGLMTFATASLSLLVMAFIMARLNGPLTMVALALAPLLVIGIRAFVKAMRQRTASAQQSDSRVTALVQQAIAALPLTQSYTREDFESDRFRAEADEAQTRRLAQHGTELGYGFVVAVIFGFGTAVTTWLGARQVLAGALTVGELFIFLSYLVLLYEPLSQLSYLGATVAGALAGGRRVFEILDTPDEVVAPSPPVKAPSTGGIVLTGVSFAYAPGRDVLCEVSFALSTGEAAAIVGPSGAGKTTLLLLLPRFFDAARGRVEVGGLDVRQWDLTELRRQIAVVLQEPIILPATVAENIGYGKPGASAEEIAAAARAANALGFIEKLPEKFQTRIGEGAARLSAGERQRINLARAFLKDAPIILLDEPTSALDAESEALIAESLRVLLLGRTALMVAHRPATIAACQRVLVMEEGRVTEYGTPEELRAKGGYFARVMGG